MLSSLFAKIAPNSDLSITLFPPKPTFTVEDIPDLSGKVIIVTGAAGIGYETAKQLLRKNAKVYIAGRSKEKCEKSIAELKESTGKEAIWLKLDLGDLPAIEKSAEEFLSKEKHLDILYNNAGVMAPPTDQLTAQGYDLQFGTNVLGHYYFTKLLLPALKACKAATGNPARVITVSSSAHNILPKTSFTPNGCWSPETLVGGPERDAVIKKWGGIMAPWLLYGQSKAGSIVLSNYIAKENSSDTIVAAHLHPGGIKTELQRHQGGFLTAILNIIMWPQPYGALTQLYAGTIATPDQMNGKFFVPWGRVGKANDRATNPALPDELSKWCEEQIAKI